MENQNRAELLTLRERRRKRRNMLKEDQLAREELGKERAIKKSTSSRNSGRSPCAKYKSLMVNQITGNPVAIPKMTPEVSQRNEWMQCAICEYKTRDTQNMNTHRHFAHPRKKWSCCGKETLLRNHF